jgi:hypothetical protein
LKLLTPHAPPGNLSKIPPILMAIPAYWRIEGNAVILYRALQENEAREHKSAKEGKRRRGRPRDTNPKADEKIWDAWSTGEHKTYGDLARLQGTSAAEVARAIDRHRRRRERASTERRTNSPDK